MSINDIFYLLYLVIITAGFIATLYTLFRRDYLLKESANALLECLFILSTSSIILVISLLLHFLGLQNMMLGLVIISILLFIISLSFLFYVFLKTYARIYHFREKNYLKHMFPLKYYFQRKKFYKKDYETHKKEDRGNNPEIIKSLPFNFEEEDIKLIKKGYSFLLTGKNDILIEELAIALLIDGLMVGETANYVCVDKHPIQIWETAKMIDSNIEDHYENLVFIDGYTPNYGFDDEILEYKIGMLKDEGIQVVKGKTLPGIHTATAKAFNITKNKVKERQKNKRPPNRMVYDSISSMIDIASEEELKIFLNHMISAEKNYGMISFMIEYSNNNKILDLLKKNVDCIVEFKKTEEGEIMSKITKARGLNVKKFKEEKWLSPIFTKGVN